ncbi:phosphate ABC transporter substrate-binding protein PstS [Nonomuraea sediminis]|uniref:phosphate ABC transporter substrate-binding protein PstS n=1 Tax=Nonomuraea sediminis TaxID=2835864 RepID=UPI001BDD9613|nr:phosphate ABC transporter substrate-binding protein PstS [Nonomuraea sediminis]
MGNATAAGAAALLVAVALAACGTVEERSASPLPGQAATIIGSGSTAQLSAIDAWRAGFARIVPGANIVYQPVGSGEGVRNFIRGHATFAGSDFVMSSEQRLQADKRCAGRAFHLPMVVSPIALVYNLDMPDLKLSPGTITGVFSGKITRWDDHAIAHDNPGANLPHAGIRVFHRIDDSGTSKNLTRFLRQVGGWPYKPSTTWLAPGGEGVVGSAQMTDAVKTSDHSIGYVEYGYASAAQLRMAKVKNAAGEYVELSPESASASVAGARVVGTGGDLAVKLDSSVKKPGAYPMVMLTYEIVCSKGSPPLLRGFLGYAAGNAGQSNLSLLGYAPLPPELLAQVRASLDSMT